MILHLNLQTFPIRQNRSFLLRGGYFEFNEFFGDGIYGTRVPVEKNMPYTLSTIVRQGYTLKEFVNSVTIKLEAAGYTFVGWQQFNVNARTNTNKNYFRLVYMNPPSAEHLVEMKRWCRTNWNGRNWIVPDGGIGIIP